MLFARFCCMDAPELFEVATVLSRKLNSNRGMQFGVIFLIGEYQENRLSCVKLSKNC